MSGRKSHSGRFRPYPSYKPSGVDWLGQIPSHWRTTRLRYVTTVPSKQEVRALDPELAASFLPMEAVGENGELRLDVSKPIQDMVEGYTYFRDGDVVVAKITPCFENGKGALAASLENGIGFGTTELHVLRARDPINPRYLYYLTISDPFRRLGAAAMYGAGGQKRVPEDFISNFRAPLPEQAEQIRIASFLDRETARTDDLLSQKSRLIEALDEYRDAFRARCLLPDLRSSHWTSARLRDAADSIQTGPFGSQLHASDYVRGGYPVINPANITENGLVADEEATVQEATRERLSQHVLRTGDIVIGRRGEMARCGIVSDAEAGWICGTGSLRIRPRGDIDPRYLFHVLSSNATKAWLELHAVGTTMQNLSTSIVDRIPIAVPPFEEQLGIVKAIEGSSKAAEAMTTCVTDGIERISELRAGLISAATTGQVDVRGMHES